MVKDPSGKLSTLPISIKEGAHQFPMGFSAITGVSEKERHRLLGNSWHLGVASEMLQFVMSHGVRETNDGSNPYVSWGSPPLDLSSTLRLNLKRPIALHKVPEWLSHIDMTPAKDMMEHWSHSD